MAMNSKRISTLLILAAMLIVPTLDQTNRTDASNWFYQGMPFFNQGKYGELRQAYDEYIQVDLLKH